MAIYRPRRSRWPLLVALALLAFITGLALGAMYVGARPIDLDAAAAKIAEGLSGSAGLLEVVEIEYAEAHAGGGADSEYQAALDNLARSEERYAAVSSALSRLDPARTERIEAAFDEAHRRIDQRVTPAELGEVIDALRAELTR